MNPSHAHEAPVPRRGWLSRWHLVVLLLVWLLLNPAWIVIGGSALWYHRLLLHAYTMAGPLIEFVGNDVTPDRLREVCIALAIFAPLLLIAVAAQVFSRPRSTLGKSWLLALWAAGWSSWFLGGAIMIGRAMG